MMQSPRVTLIPIPSPWYGLVDGVMAAGSHGPLATPAARQQEGGVKETDEPAAARW